MVPSEVRALFSVASRPGVVSLAGGMPDVTALPADALGELLGELAVTRTAVALQYGSAQGDPALRERICEVMAMEGIRARADDVVVTVGSQQALDLTARIFLDPDDVVVTEAPTYVTALNVFAAYQARIVSVPMDSDGVIPNALEETLRRLAEAGRRPKLFYTVPTFHNPVGVTLADARRPAVVDICGRAGVLIVEDNPYGLLAFDHQPRRALRADAPDGVLYLGSFSKTLAPAFRVGWALAPPSVRDKLVLAAEGAILSHSVLAQLVVERCLATQPWPEHLKAMREMYRERRDAMLDALATWMPPGCLWTRPDGGFFVWVTLPPGVDSKEMLARAVAAGVAYVPGSGFFADGTGHGHLRLSYSHPAPELIREGVRRLAGLLTATADM
ncbi:PLP-dependent aminotransferase family protein [Streptomyces sp. NPDC046909]|uniref:aminotransferase-like domain-containing protein n=1 Tax=Streptomyces sp. NPDC046909 TaxID=3155617 RepID=UPI0033FA28E4